MPAMLAALGIGGDINDEGGSNHEAKSNAEDLVAAAEKATSIASVSKNHPHHPSVGNTNERPTPVVAMASKVVPAK